MASTTPETWTGLITDMAKTMPNRESHADNVPADPGREERMIVPDAPTASMSLRHALVGHRHRRFVGFSVVQLSPRL